jgi:hypothetical protein
LTTRLLEAKVVPQLAEARRPRVAEHRLLQHRTRLLASTGQPQPLHQLAQHLNIVRSGFDGFVKPGQSFFGLAQTQQ